MASPDIFISYNREDAAVARLYADAFTAAGLEVWWDATLRSGEDYDAVTEHSLRTAKAVVVLWSPRSVNSRWVRAEATIADRGQTLMPVMIEACDRPVMFELKQTAEMSHWRGDTGDPDWQSLVADVRRKVGKLPDDEHAEAAPAVRMPAGAGAAAGATLGRVALAVLPFGARGGGEVELLAEDLTEDVTRELAYNGFFKVIAAGTMAAWRGKTIDHKDLGKRLDARYLVEGRVQQSGSDTRLTAQLIDGSSGNVLWSTRMSAAQGDAGSQSESLAVALAAQCAEQVVQREQARAMARAAPYTAWDHVLRSAACSRRGDEESACLAVAEARLAVAAAPDVGLAHALLASSLAALPESQGRKPDDEQIREIQTRTRQAMRLDGNNPSVLMALAGAYQGLGEHEICLRLARRIVDLWPSSPASHLILGDSLRMLGRTGEAIEAYREQDRLAPYDSSRNVALTHLGMCLLLEGQAEEAEAVLDRALTLDPEYAPALEWKAIVADQLGKKTVAVEAMRQVRSAERAMPLDRHVWQIERNEHLRDRTAAHVATLRRLWRVAGDEPAEAVEVRPAPEPVRTAPIPEPVAVSAAPAAVAVLDEASSAPAAPAEDPALEPMMFAEPVKPAARKQDKREAAVDDYVVAAPAPAPANDPGPVQSAAPAVRRMPRAAVLAGALLLVGGGAAAWIGGVGRKSESSGPAFALAAAPVAANSAIDTPVADVAAVAPVTGTAPQPVSDALSALIAVSRSARRPAAELAALEGGRQSLQPLIAQLQTAPGDVAVAQQMRAVAASLVQQQAGALSADADRVLGQQQQAAAAGKGLSPEGQAKVDRALGRVRSARGEVASALVAAGRAPDAAGVLVAQRSAVAAYVRMQSVPVSAAVASARTAAATAVAVAAVDTAKMQNRLSKVRVDIQNTRGEVAKLYSQVAGMTQVEKAGLFASGAKRQSHKLRKDNADRARALVTEADQILTQSAAVQDVASLENSLARMRGLRTQASSLLASSTAALKAAPAAPAQSASPTPTAASPTRK